MDHKMAQRRHRVSEERARNRLRLVIGAVALLALGAAGFLVLRSPLLSVSEITITGSEQSDAWVAIERVGVVEGTPTIDVDATALEAALLTDPWIAQATVTVTWPGSVEVEVVEHVPVALVTVANGYAHLAASGAVVQLLDDPAGWPLIVVPEPRMVRPGGVLLDAAIRGAIEFVSGLPPELAATTIVVVDDQRFLSATVGEYRVRLGRSIEMASKAAALMGLIGHGVEPGSHIDVTAPRRPAVANTQAQVEDEG
jgi:cell division protein FtsQ